jgi:transposase InsO family protein
MDAPHRIARADARIAELRFHGFSKPSPRNPFEPHLFEYEDPSIDPKWPTMAGYYTRYGDVIPLLAGEDDRYAILAGGDEVALEFAESDYPALEPGWTRTWFLYDTGWDKDANRNTAFGETVEPLPFRGMSGYPYGPGEAYPEDEAHGEFESEHPGYRGARDTFHVGNLKGVGRVYQQTFADTYAKVAFARLHDRKTPLTAADLLNDRVAPFFDSHDVKPPRALTGRGTEYCGNPERHEYELYLAVEDIDHSRTKTKSPRTNGIVERFHGTVPNEFHRIAFRRKIYRPLEEPQADLDAWIAGYNEERPHQGRWRFGKTPMQTFLDAIPIAKEKTIAA